MVLWRILGDFQNLPKIALLWIEKKEAKMSNYGLVQFCNLFHFATTSISAEVNKVKDVTRTSFSNCFAISIYQMIINYLITYANLIRKANETGPNRRSTTSRFALLIH